MKRQPVFSGFPLEFVFRLMYNETILKNEVKRVKRSFGEALSAARRQNGMSQQQLADALFVNRSSVANWEADRRLPDSLMIAKIAEVLGVEATELFDASKGDLESPVVIIVDDSKIILTGGLPIIEKAIPNATVFGFTKPSQAVEFAKTNRVSLAFLDIELGAYNNGLDLCKTLLDVNPHTNVVFLTAFGDYSIDAWETEASGFMLKPITEEGVKTQLKKLRHPFVFGGCDK